MDRFSQGLPDHQERPAALIANCVQCRSAIYLGDEVVELSGDYFCDGHCLMRYLGATVVAAGMEDLHG